MPLRPSKSESPGFQKLVMALLVRDEEDILDMMINFHLNCGVDFIYVIDNASEDSTREILDKYKRKGVLHYRVERKNNYDQAAWMTEAIRYCFHTYHASWVIPSDADEFWVPANGNLKRALLELDAIGNWASAAIPRHNMIAAKPQDKSKQFDLSKFEYMVSDPVQFKENVSQHWEMEHPWIFHKLPSKVIIRRHDFTSVDMGNHNILGVDEPAIQCNSIQIFHYPIRTWKHFESKIRKGGRALISNNSYSRDLGWHWRRWYQLSEKGQLNIEYERQFPSKNSLRRLQKVGIISKSKRPLRTIARRHDDEPDHLYDRAFYAMHEQWKEEYELIATYLCSHLDFQSAVDFGCGNAYLLSYLEKQGKTVVGIEGSIHALDYAKSNIQGDVHHQDLRLPIYIDQFDLVICTEVAEHIDESFADTLLDNLVRAKPKYLFFTGATPEQTGGINHVNLQPHQYWYDKLAQRGYHVDSQKTNGLRSLLQSSNTQMHWFEKNSTILKKGSC